MTNPRTLKLLIDLLFFTHIFMLLLIVIFHFLEIGELKFTENTNSGLINWVMTIFSSLSYVCFGIGLFFFRKTAHFFIINKSISLIVSASIRRAGVSFLAAGIINILLMLFTFIMKVTEGKMELVFGTDSVFSVFLLIVGVFLFLQSKTLEQAKEYQDEINLTV